MGLAFPANMRAETLEWLLFPAVAALWTYQSSFQKPRVVAASLSRQISQLMRIFQVDGASKLWKWFK